MKRKFISINLSMINQKGNRITKNVCISPNNKAEKLYKLTKSLESDSIKKEIPIFSYDQLIEISQKSSRKPSQSIKYKFKKFCTEKNNSNNNCLNGVNDIKN